MVTHAIHSKEYLLLLKKKFKSVKGATFLSKTSAFLLKIMFWWLFDTQCDSDVLGHHWNNDWYHICGCCTFTSVLI